MSQGKDFEVEEELQRHLLQKLDAYGDSVIESKLKSLKKKKRKLTSEKGKGNKNTEHRKDNSQECTRGAHTGNTDSISKRKKRKLKKFVEKSEQKASGSEQLSESREESKKTVVGQKKQMSLLVGELGLKQFKSEMQGTNCDNELELSVDTGNQNAVKREPEVVVFTSHRNIKPKDKKQTAANIDSKGENTATFDIKEARFEVRKFGLAGFHGMEKEKAMTDLLLKLGAKPKKKAHVNYKLLQEQRKEELILEAQRTEQDKRNGLKVGMKKNNKRERDRSTVDGQVGKFVHGIQFVKPNDLQGLKKSKLKVKK